MGRRPGGAEAFFVSEAGGLGALDDDIFYLCYQGLSFTREDVLAMTLHERRYYAALRKAVLDEQERQIKAARK